MAIYFVDYENVGSAGIEGIDQLSAENIVHIFYSVKADTMKMDQVIQLMKVAAQVEFHDVTMRGQKNALDFQLIAMLYFTKRDEDTCYIISKDQGYDAAIVFGRTIGAEQVFRRVSLNSENISDTKVPQQTRRSGRRSEPSRSSGHMTEQPKTALLAERAQGVTGLSQAKDGSKQSEQTGRHDQSRREHVRNADPAKKESHNTVGSGKKEVQETAEAVKKEAAKPAETAKKEAAKPAETAKKEAAKPAETAKKETAKPAEPVKKNAEINAEPVKTEVQKTAESAGKDVPKTAEPAKKEETSKTGIPAFHREVVVVKTVENTGKTQTAPASKAPEPVKKEAAVPAGGSVKTEEKPQSAQIGKTEEKPQPAQTGKPEETVTPTQPVKKEEAPLPAHLKAAAQWDIFQSSIGGLFDYEIPEDFDDDEEGPFGDPGPAAANTEDQKEQAEPAPEDKESEGEAAPAEETRHSRSRSRQSRRRGQRRTESSKAEEETEQQEKQETVPSAETAAEKAKPQREQKKEARGKSEPKKEAKAHPGQNKDGKEQPEKKKEAKGQTQQKREAKASPEIRRDHAEVLGRVTERMQTAGFALEQEEYALIADALLSTTTKNQFYQFFRKKKGEAAGREFYLRIRGQYESLKLLREA